MNRFFWSSSGRLLAAALPSHFLFLTRYSPLPPESLLLCLSFSILQARRRHTQLVKNSRTRLYIYTRYILHHFSASMDSNDYSKTCHFYGRTESISDLAFLNSRSYHKETTFGQQWAELSILSNNYWFFKANFIFYTSNLKLNLCLYCRLWSKVVKSIFFLRLPKTLFIWWRHFFFFISPLKNFFRTSLKTTH